MCFFAGPSQTSGCQGVAMCFFAGPSQTSGCQGVAMCFFCRSKSNEWLPGCCYVVSLLLFFLQVQVKQVVARTLLSDCYVVSWRSKSIKWLPGCCYMVAMWIRTCLSQKSCCQGVAIWLLGGFVQVQVKKKWLPRHC